MSPTQCAAPTEFQVHALAQTRRGAFRPRPARGGQQREQLVGLPAHDHVRVAQAGGEQWRDRIRGPQRHTDPHQREVAPVTYALGDEAVQHEAAHVRAGQHEAAAHDATLTRQRAWGEMDEVHTTGQKPS